MRINVGSGNPVKRETVREVFSKYDLFAGAEIVLIETDAGVSDYPRNRAETVIGSRNRSIRAFENGSCSYSVGLQSGLMTFDDKSFYNFCACTLYNGKTAQLGYSSLILVPPRAMTILKAEPKLTLDRALQMCGLINNSRVGPEGVVGVLSKGHITRQNYIGEAIRAALVPLQTPEVYN